MDYERKIAALNAEIEKTKAERDAHNAAIVSAERYDGILAASSEDYPIPHSIGDPVTEGYWYACQRIKARAMKTGIPAGMTDGEYFSEWVAF